MNGRVYCSELVLASLQGPCTINKRVCVSSLNAVV